MRSNNVILLFLGMLLFPTCLPCFAADKEQQAIWTEDGVEHEGMLMSAMDEVMKRMIDEMAKTDPEAAAKLKSRFEQDRNKFEAEFQQAIREEIQRHFKERMKGEGGPFGTDRGRRGFGQQGGEARGRGRGRYQMHEPGSPPPPRESQGPGHRGKDKRHGRRGERGGFIERQVTEHMEWLEKNSPEEAKELAELKEKHPALAMRKTGLSMRKYRKIREAEDDNPELAKALKEDLQLKAKRNDLLKEIKSETDKEKRNQLVSELETVVSSRFDLILKRKQIAYEQLIKKLEELKSKVKINEAELDKWKDVKVKQDSIEARIEELLSDVNTFEWQ